MHTARSAYVCADAKCNNWCGLNYQVNTTESSWILQGPVAHMN